MNYRAETRPDTCKTKKFLETTAMKIVRRIMGKTLMNRVRSGHIRQMCKTERTNDWNQHIHFMREDRLVRAAKDSVGRPRNKRIDNLDRS